MHPDLLYAYDASLPRLQAIEQLRLVQAVAAGTGAMPRADARRLVADLHAQANPGWRSRGASRPRSREEHEQATRAHGIAVRHVARTSRPQGDGESAGGVGVA